MNAGEQAVTVREDSLAPAAVHARMQYARALAASGLLPDAYLSPTGPPPAAPVDWGGHAGPDDVVADLNRQCADLVRRFTAKFGGDPEQIAAAWEHDGGVADPEALTRWLMARIPHATEQDETIGETITDMEAFARSVADRVLASEEGDTE